MKNVSFIAMDIISSERITLKLVQESDLDWFYALLSHPDVMRFSLKGPLNRQEAQEVMYRDGILSFEQNRFALFSCWLKETAQPIGFCGLSVKTVDEEFVPELGYRLFPDFWGRGYATEAIRAVKKYAFEVLDLPKIVSIIEPLNTPSIRVAQKNGILYEKSTLYKDVNVGIFTAYNSKYLK